MNRAVILAGGTGSRFLSDTPKQFLYLGGRMMIEYVIDACLLSRTVDSVLVVCHKDYVHLVHPKLNVAESSEKNIEVIEGGKSRIESTLLGFSRLDLQKDDSVILLEANRPMVTGEHIDQLHDRFVQEKASCAFYFSPITESLFCTKENGEKKWLDKSTCALSQTPYIFDANVVSDIVNNIQSDGYTDYRDILDFISPLKKHAVHKGRFVNVKITSPHDLLFAQALMKSEDKTR